jgi:hypothetical protein
MTFNQSADIPLRSEQFVKEYPKFCEALSPLYATMIKLFVREGVPEAGADTLAFFLGVKCCEEFFEIVSLAASGYSVGPIRLLRSLFEDAVTLAYLAKNPDEVENFMDFHAIHVYRAHEGFKTTFGKTVYESHFPADRIKQTQDEFERVKGKFRTPKCDKCKAGGMQHSWTKKDIGTMANLIGDEYKFLYMECYFFPMLHLHTTPISIMNQMKAAGGKLSVNPESGKELIENALCAAHRLIVQMLFTQNDHFKLGLDEELITRFDECMEAWPDSPSSVSSQTKC